MGRVMRYMWLVATILGSVDNRTFLPSQKVLLGSAGLDGQKNRTFCWPGGLLQ